MTTEPLTVQGVGHRFGGTPALRDCTFTVTPGAVVALLGRNGAGKTTLLRAIAGLLPPQHGTIRVYGQPPGTASPRIGYVSQQARLYPMLTVRETLRLGARLNPGWDTPYADGLADAAGLPPRATVRTLTAGQRTRLALVMALGKRPDLLVLDEPLANLDPVARADLTGALMGVVADNGTTVLMSSHVVADIDGVCDHVVVLGDGRIRLAAEVEPALAGHRLAVGAVRDHDALDGLEVVHDRTDGGEFTALVRGGGPPGDTRLTWHTPTLEELLMGYLRAEAPESARGVAAA
jgi:ABC-2 type transport system ATP-binding protein